MSGEKPADVHRPKHGETWVDVPLYGVPLVGEPVSDLDDDEGDRLF